MAETAQNRRGPLADLGPTCRHVDGRQSVMDRKGCSIGHPIERIVATKLGTDLGLALRLPCRPGPERAADCPNYDPETPEEIAARKARVRAAMDEMLPMLKAAADWRMEMVQARQRTATKDCPCCGAVGSVSVHCAIGYNNHIGARCSACKRGFQQ